MCGTSIVSRVRECQSFFCAVFLVSSVNADIFLYRFVLRSYIAQRAIEAAENGDFSVVSNLQKVRVQKEPSIHAAIDSCGKGRGLRGGGGGV